MTARAHCSRVPSKGPLEGNAEAFFTRAGLAPGQAARLMRDYRRHHRRARQGRDCLLISGERDTRPSSRAGAFAHIGSPAEDLWSSRCGETIADARQRVLCIDSLASRSDHVVGRRAAGWRSYDLCDTMRRLDDVTTALEPQHKPAAMRGCTTKYII